MSLFQGTAKNQNRALYGKLSAPPEQELWLATRPHFGQWQSSHGPNFGGGGGFATDEKNIELLSLFVFFFPRGLEDHFSPSPII